MLRYNHLNQIVLSFNHLAWRGPRLGRELGIRGGYFDVFGSQTFRHVKEGFKIDACRREDAPREPIENYVGQKLIFCKRLPKIDTMVASCPEFFKKPG